MSVEFDSARAVWQRDCVDLFPQIWMQNPTKRPDQCNGQVIRLDCSSRSFLRWKEEIALALEIAQRGCLLVWHLDTGLNRFCIHRCDEGVIEAILRAYEYFSSKIWPRFANSSLCALLHVGSAGKDASFDQIKAMSEIWRTLSSALPLECAAGPLLDVSQLPLSEQLRALHKEHFCHLHLFLKTELPQLAALGWNAFHRAGSFWSIPPSKMPIEADLESASPITLALLQPKDRGDLRIWQLLGDIAEKLEELHFPYRIISMSSLHEQWHRLDQVIVVEPLITLRERRQLEGFCAANGAVISAGGPLGLEIEIAFGEWEQRALRLSSRADFKG